LKHDDVVRDVGSGLGGVDGVAAFAGQSALDEDDEDDATAVESDDDDDSLCAEMRAIDSSGTAVAPARAAISTARGITDLMGKTFSAMKQSRL